MWLFSYQNSNNKIKKKVALHCLFFFFFFFKQRSREYCQTRTQLLAEWRLFYVSFTSSFFPFHEAVRWRKSHTLAHIQSN